MFKGQYIPMKSHELQKSLGLCTVSLQRLRKSKKGSCISKWLAGPVSPTCPSCKQQLTIPGLDKDRHVDTSQVQVTNV